ncbi:MAG: DUF3626 domain-containing protein [Candidatus Colwellbacteria bacterium]|nr:DUF3626 domain-containing protein [Candidatus Colwellbacteria bacterium]
MAAPYVVPIIFEDSDEEEIKLSTVTVCPYIFVKGVRKGETCGKKCKEKYCSVHKERKGIVKSWNKRDTIPPELLKKSMVYDNAVEEMKEGVYDNESEELNEDGLTARQQSALDYAMCLEKKIPSPPSTDAICLANFIQFICPISINFPSAILHKLVNDTHVRNGFETKRGLDKTIRPTWESKLFNTYYDKSVPFERPKYGAIKTNPLSMVSNNSTMGYGDAVFILKDEVKRRCTMTPGDSSIFAADNVYTFDQIQEMLMKHPHVRNHIMTCYQAYEREDHAGSKEFASYIEVQIHGQLLFSSIAKLVILSKDEGLRMIATRFGEKNKCEVVFL